MESRGGDSFLSVCIIDWLILRFSATEATGTCSTIYQAVTLPLRGDKGG